jgi:hypothetical protein
VSEATATTIVNVSSGTTLALSEVLGTASRMRCVQLCRFIKIARDRELYTSSRRCAGRSRRSELHTGIAL